MSAFDRSDTRSDGLFVLTELDSTGEAGEYDLEIPVEGDVATIAVMIEGDALDTSVEIDKERIGPDLQMDRTGERGSARKLILRVGDKLNSVRLKIWTQGQKAKVSILQILRGFAKDFKKRLSCTACKRLIRFLLVWIATSFGIPNLPIDGQIPASVWRRLQEVLNVNWNALPPIIAKLLAGMHGAFIDKLIDGLKWLSVIFDDMYKPIDTALEKICRGLGFCAEAAKAS